MLPDPFEVLFHLPSQWLRFDRHAMAQTGLLADQPDRFKQCARYILEQHPVGRPMNVELQTSAVDQANGGVYRLVQSHHLPGQKGIAHHLSQGPVQSPQLLFAEKLRGPLQGALGDAPYAVDMADTTKVGQQIAAAQSPRQMPKRNPTEQITQRFHTQRLEGKTGPLLPSLQTLRLALLQGQLDDLRFHLRIDQQPVDTLDGGAKVFVIGATLNHS